MKRMPPLKASKDFLDSIKESEEQRKKKSEELGEIIKMAHKEYEGVTEGKVTQKAMYIMGFIAGYTKKKL